ncbi:unnamed protein product [Linum tenue]|uniref:RING-type domain-containing protein n=1 Tax=Linum tenue TaxID=586396 RepID=A0AAV0JZB8_9ROSI|nr:unnamed protein product [Linum tenue]
MNASTTNCTTGDLDADCVTDSLFLELFDFVALCVIVVVIVVSLYKFVRRRCFPPPPPPPPDDQDNNNNHTSNNNNNNSVVVEVNQAAASGGLRNTVRVFKKSGGEGDEEQGRVGDECSICLEELKNGEECSSLDVCGHLYHKECFEPWLAQNHDCPLCRASVHTRPTTVRMFRQGGGMCIV